MTELEKYPPWLRVAYDSEATNSDVSHVYVEETQLSLPFEKPDVISIIDVADFEFNSFSRILSELRPKWVFDIRAAPRMDRLAGGRAHAFREFDRVGTRYIDIFGIIGVSNYRTAVANPLYWTPLVERFLKETGTVTGPFMALLDDDSLMRLMPTHFAASIAHVTGRNVALSKLTNRAE